MDNVKNMDLDTIKLKKDAIKRRSIIVGELQYLYFNWENTLKNYYNLNLRYEDYNYNNDFSLGTIEHLTMVEERLLKKLAYYSEVEDLYLQELKNLKDIDE